MALGGDGELRYSPSPRSLNISNAITQSLLSSFTLTFLVFGPGKGSKTFDSHRLPVKKLIENLRQIASFPEDIEIPSENSLGKMLANNPATKELHLMNEYDYTIILMMSQGSISEYSLFFSKIDLAHKIKPFIDQKYKNAQSYVMDGPVKAFEGVYKVFYYNGLEDLLEKVKEMVYNVLLFRSLQN